MTLTRFIIRRVLRAAVTVLLLTLFVHGGLALLPGDPIRALFGQARPDPSVYEALRAQYDFDRPWVVQYVTYLKDMATGNWGYSFPGIVRSVARVGPPVADVVRAAAPVSARLVAPVLLIQLVVGSGIGALAVAYRSTRRGAALHLAAVTALGIPVIALAYMLQMGFGWHLRWLPMIGGPDGWETYVLPVASLSLTTTALVILFARSHLQDVLRQPFVKATIGRGIRRRRVIALHAMKLSLPSFVELVVANLGQLITALIIVETIYGIPGLGSTLYRAIFNRDRPLLLALLVLTTVTVTTASAVADVTRLLLDARTRETT